MVIMRRCGSCYGSRRGWVDRLTEDRFTGRIIRINVYSSDPCTLAIEVGGSVTRTLRIPLVKLEKTWDGALLWSSGPFYADPGAGNQPYTHPTKFYPRWQFRQKRQRSGKK